MVEVEQLQRLGGRHRRERGRLVGAPRGILARAGQPAFEEDALQPFIPFRERRADFAREGGVGAAALVEGGGRGTGGGGREADVGGGGQGEQEALLAGARYGVAARAAELEAAVPAKADGGLIGGDAVAVPAALPAAGGRARAARAVEAGVGGSERGVPSRSKGRVDLSAGVQRAVAHADRAGGGLGIAGAGERAQEGGVLPALGGG